MLKPLLIIGLGGSGGKTIRSMKQALTRRLESARYDIDKKGMPEAWQFLQIDTTYDGVDFPAPMLPRNEVHLVVPSGASFDSIRDSITNKGTLHEQQNMMAGWGVANSSVPVGAGAGQIRAIGRQVGVADSARTFTALQASIAKLNSPTALAELAEVAKTLGAKSPVNRIPQVIIISSIAGGSGAGMFIDVAELIKRATPNRWGKETIAFLYTAEVFKSLEEAGKDVAKNSLGAMNELIAGKWVGISERSELLYSKLGLIHGTGSPKKEFGAAGNILIGTHNKTGIDISLGADAAGMDEVFLTIGEALAGIFTESTIAEWVFQVAFVNIISTKSAIDNSGLAPENPVNPTFAAGGMGFGQLTLGADRIVDYVADALTKRQVEILLWPSLTDDLLKDGATIVSLIREETNKIWPNFLLASGLDEKGSQDQILDALFPQDWKNKIKQFTAGVISRSVTKNSVPLARFAQGIWSEWETNITKFLEDSKNDTKSQANLWVKEIQEDLREQVGNELMQSGYGVLTDLITRLVTELREHSLVELKREHQSLSDSVRGFNQASFNGQLSKIAGGLSGVSLDNGEFLQKLQKDLARVLELQIASNINDLAASLVEDMLSYVFKPLIEQLINARFTLQKQQKSITFENGSKNPFNSFPEWGSGIVDSRYKPRTIERILIDHSEYEATYELYAAKDSAGKSPFGQSVSSSLLGIKMNPGPGEINSQTLIRVASSWITSVREAQTDKIGAVVTKMDWNFQTGLTQLIERNRKWLKDEDSSFGKFTNMSIRKFVSAPSEPPAIRDARESKFVKEYQAMLALAQPLVLLNPSAMNYVLAVSDGKPADGVILKSSKIPFDVTSSIGQSCTNILLNNGINVQSGSFAPAWFDPGCNDTTMFAAAATQASLPAWAFASLTEPILTQVGQSKNDGGTWLQFWNDRRGRPLIEAVPFETEIRSSIVTGWFVATLFGMREFQSGAVGKSVQIWNPTLQTPGWSQFPNPLLPSHLEDQKHESWVLPALLMSAGIALSNFGKTGNQEFIHGYQLLKFLGREVTTGISNNRDNWDLKGMGDLLPTGILAQSTYIKDWLSTGSKPAEKLDLLPLLQANLSENPDRGSALAETVKKLREEYADVWSKFSNVAWHKLPETWELKDDINLALSDIMNYVNDIHITSTGTSD